MRLCSLLPVALLIACGDNSDDPGDGGTTTGETDVWCSFTGDFSGAFDLQARYDENQGCSGSGSGDSVSFSWGIDSDLSVLLWINQGVDVSQGSQTGLPATLAVIESTTFSEWRSVSDGCTVDLIAITEDSSWEDSWVFEGEGSCPGALVNDSDASEVTVSPFSFLGGAPM